MHAKNRFCSYFFGTKWKTWLKHSNNFKNKALDDFEQADEEKKRVERQLDQMRRDNSELNRIVKYVQGKNDALQAMATQANILVKN